MEQQEGKKYLVQNVKVRHGLRVAGWIFLSAGIVCDIFGAIAFATSFGSFYTPSPLIFLLWLGIPLTFVGVSCLIFGYLGTVQRYFASEVAPVMKDTTNYMMDGTRKETVQTIKEAADAIKGKDTAPVCPKCGTKNEAGAKFCDHCGSELKKKCPYCGEENDVDSFYCRKCGKHL